MANLLSTSILLSTQSIFSVIENNLESSSSDDEENIADILKLITERGPLVLRPRVKNYLENVIVFFSDEGFKEHFR